MSKKEQYLQRDRALRAITSDMDFRAVLIKATDLVNDAAKKHNLNPLASIVLGELLIAAVISTGDLKGEERISIRLNTDGQIQSALAEANAAGEVRGYLGNSDLTPLSEDPAEMKKLAIGKGTMNVTKILHSRANPVTSTIELSESVIVKDLARYYTLSQQIPTAVKIDIQFNEDYTIKHAFGLLLQAMPGADEESILELENDIIDHPNLGEVFNESVDLNELLNHFLKKKTWTELTKTPIDFFCRCSKEKFLNGLILLSTQDLEELGEKDQELVCHFCNEKYIISADEIAGLLNTRRSKKK